MMLQLLHETGIVHAHPHLEPLVIAAVIAGLLAAGWMVRRSLTRHR